MQGAGLLAGQSSRGFACAKAVALHEGYSCPPRYSDCAHKSKGWCKGSTLSVSVRVNLQFAVDLNKHTSDGPMPH